MNPLRDTGDMGWLEF